MSEREQTDAASPALAVPKAGKDWRESQFNYFFKTFDFWKDWRSIRADPLVIINDPSQLQTKPFSYALTAMLLPGLILATTLGGIGMFVNIPKTQIDRAIEEEQDRKNDMQRLIDDHSKHDINDPLYDPSLEELSTEKLDKLDSDLSRQIDRLASSPDKSQETRTKLAALSRRDLQVSHVLIGRIFTESLPLVKDEVIDNSINLLRIKKLTEVTGYFDKPLVSLFLICNAYVFTILVRRLRTTPNNIAFATDAHLYSLGTSLVFPAMVGALLVFLLDMSIRFDLNVYYEHYIYLNLALTLWFWLALVFAGRRLGIILDGDTSFTGRLTWRLLASQVVVWLAVQLALIPFIAILLWFIAKTVK